ncbi:MAG: glutamate--cysteine ligase, partial [Aeromicrobium sp.]
MGQDVEAREFSREDRTRYRAKVRRCLDVFARMLSERDFTFEHTHVGIEIEFNLVDEHGDPALTNAEALDAIADPDFQTELGLFNVEINVPPARIEGAGLDTLQAALRDDLNLAQEKAAGVGSHLLMIGILPTLQEGHFSRHSISANPRYHLLSEQILAARGEDIEIVIDGVDRLDTTADTIIPESACTSTQLHLQVETDDFAPMWNSAQAIAGVQVAIGANSPFLLGQQLWHETRIALFEQATDTRSEELKAQGVRPRVFFGERWITSVFDLFEENARYFHALIPICTDEDPEEVLAAGGVPQLGELTLHNG